jgi:SSS family solute:Na+ symporter
MWSITLADMAQFVIKTVGVFALMLPFALSSAGGFSGIADRAGAEFFDITGIGAQSIITYFVVYTLGLLIGQDIWQRVFTSKTPQVARWGGATAGIYCILYGVAGAVIGMAASVILPDIESKDDVYADIAINVLPVGIGGLVLAAAVAAMMSTASGALIAAATVARADVLPYLRSFSRRGTAPKAGGAAGVSAAAPADAHDVNASRWWVFGLGVAAIALAIVVQDVVAALTIAYDILVGGLLVSILGGLLWKRGNGLGAGVSMAVGTLVTLGTMIYLEVNAENQYDGIYANEPIYYGLAASALAYVFVSLTSPRTDLDVMAAWEKRVAGTAPEDAPAGTAPEDAPAGRIPARHPGSTQTAGTERS